jgi:hypothetical protein
MPLIPLPRLVRFQSKLTHTILLLPLCLSGSLARADLLDPLDFTPLGTFKVTNGGYLIDTDALTISQTNGVATNLHLSSSILVPSDVRRIVVHPSPNAVLPRSRL